MTVPTAEQLSRLRQRPHYTRLHLSVYEPNTVLAAQIDHAGITRGEREINITVIAGDVFSVNRGQTVYIGTSPGNNDVGRIRAISCNASTLTIAENDFTWVDGQYLTVVQYYEPWAVFPRIVLNDNNVPLFYKDYDITYTNQNEVLDPVVNMGPNQAMFIDNTPTGSYASLWYTSSGTYDPTDDSIPTGFAWNFEGGFPTATFGPDPGFIQYTGAGHFLTSLTVTSNFGKTFTGRRHVSVYTRPDEGPAPPIVSWGLLSLEGSRDQGGWSMRFWVREDTDVRKMDAGSLVVIFTDDFEGSFEGKAGGNAENRSKILYVGYVEDDSLRRNPITNRVEFRSTAVTGRMKQLAGFSMTLEDVADAATWNEITAMSADKAMIQFLRWQSTVLAITDFAPTGDQKRVQFMDFDRADVFEAVNSLYNSSILGSIVSDRQGKIWAEVDAQIVPTGSRNYRTTLSITDQDWRSQIGIERRGDENLSYLEMGGIAYSGASTGTTDPFLAGAPGNAPLYFGGLERVSGLVIAGQAPLNELAGYALARANATYPEVVIPMAGDYRIIDIAPQERITLTLAEEDTYRGVVWNEKPFFPIEVRYEANASDQMALMEISVREETFGVPGETITIPVDPPFDTFDLPTWELPRFTLPPLPVIPPLEAPPVTGDLVYYAFQNYIARCRNFFSGATPTWETAMDVSLVANISQIWGMVLDPSDPINVALVWGVNGSTNPCIFRTINLDAASPTWTEVFGAAEATAILGGSGVAQRNIQHIRPWINGRFWSAVAIGAVGAGGCAVGNVCPKHIGSLDGITWGPTASVIAGSVNYGNPLIVVPTTWAGGTVFAGGQFRSWKSTSAGATWVQQQSNPPNYTVPVELPHLNNSSALLMYMSYEYNAIPAKIRLYESTDGGTTINPVLLTYGGEVDWGPYVENSNYGDRSDNFAVHPITGVGYGMFFSFNQTYGIFVTLSATGLSTITQFTDRYVAYSLHLGDSTIHYAGGPGTADPVIIGTNNTGLAWLDKEGNIEAAVDTFVNMGTVRSVCPVYVV